MGSDMEGHSTRKRILACAEDLFGRRGYDAVAVSDIAQACGVSTALIYYHYSDKESLLRALIDRASEVFDVHVRDAMQGTGTPRERLERFIVDWVESIESHQSLVLILVRPLTDPEGPLSAELLSRISQMIEGLAEVIAEGIESGEFAPVDAQLAAECLVGLVNTRAAAAVLNAPHLDAAGSDNEASAAFISRLFFSGITPC